VLPDDSTGQSPGTLAAKLSRCQEGMARVFAVMAGANWIIRVSRYTVDKWPGSCLGCRMLVNGHWCSVAVQVISEPESCHGAGI
jgi:hypothetical protein